MPARFREILRIADVDGPPMLRHAYGYYDPDARAYEMADRLLRPSQRRASTLAARFPSARAMARSQPEYLCDPSGQRKFVLGYSGFDDGHVLG